MHAHTSFPVTQSWNFPFCNNKWFDLWIFDVWTVDRVIVDQSYRSYLLVNIHIDINIEIDIENPPVCQ